MDIIERFLRFPIEHLPLIFVVLVIAFTLHEFAHAYFAYRFGDPTAKNMGRVSLNPRVHLDVLGTILIFIAGFGWAKPVPVNRGYFANPRLMGILVSAAGPLSNLLLAFIGLLLYYSLFSMGLFDSLSAGALHALHYFLMYLITLNILLFVFNLLPIPPLDGYRIVEDLAPQELRIRMSQYEHWGIYILLLLVFIPPLYRVTLGPVLALQHNVFQGLNQVMQSLFGFTLFPGL